MIQMSLTQFAAVTWWFLYTAAAPAPYAAGPYPTVELCRAAGHHMAPRDTRFMSEAELVAKKAGEAQEAALQRLQHDKDRAVWLKAHPGKSWPLEGVVYADGTGTISMGPWIVSGCVRVENPEPTAPAKP